MVSRPSPESGAQLVPLLGGIALLVATGAPLTETNLKTLLLATDYAESEVAVAELGDWANLLAAFAVSPTPETRIATAEALAARGLPQVAVLRALSAVENAPRTAAHARATPMPPEHPGEIDIVAHANMVVAGVKSAQGNLSKYGATQPPVSGREPGTEEIIVAQLNDLFGVSGPETAEMALPGEANPPEHRAEQTLKAGQDMAGSSKAAGEPPGGESFAQDEIRRQLDDLFGQMQGGNGIA